MEISMNKRIQKNSIYTHIFTITQFLLSLLISLMHPCKNQIKQKNNILFYKN